MQNFKLALVITFSAAMTFTATGQDNRADRNPGDSTGNYRYDKRDGRDDRAVPRGDRSNDSITKDRNRTADANDSWTEWFSDWWADASSPNSGAIGDTGSDVDSFVERQDDDQDGKLSRQELPPKMRGGFERIDRDRDGYLSKSELRQHAQRAASAKSPVVVTYVWVLDANQGKVKLEDLQQAYSELREVDQNEDGRISREELQSRQKKAASRWLDKCFQQHDENDDDQITRREAEGTHLSNRFEKLDRNGDDKLTRSELRQSLSTSSGNSRENAEGESSSASRDVDRSRQ